MLLTFDAIVIPFFRISIADLVFVNLFLVSLNSNLAFLKSVKLLVIYFPLILILNAVIYYMNDYFITSKIDVFKSSSGFIRPFFYSIISMFLFERMKKLEINLESIYLVISKAGIILTVIVFAQYFAFIPIMFHNNPSFGEVGRITDFTLGYRPTGLTNEASFIGIYLVLMLSILVFLKSKIRESLNVWERNYDILLLIGIFFTTSRLALLLALFLLIFKSSFTQKVIGLIMISILLVINASTYNRFLILFDGSGDNSTIERFGSNQAYLDAFFNDLSIKGTGYLNANSKVNYFLDPTVEFVLDGRNLPSFSLPLQLIVEFGLPIVFFLFFLLILYRKIFFKLPFVAIILCSFLTGIQNFLFVYFFFSLALYVTNNKYHS